MIKRNNYIMTQNFNYHPFYIDLLKKNHILIAGTTGSGKSVVINGMINALMVHYTNKQTQMILIDPKRVELSPYKKTAFCSRYANDTNAECTLNYVINLMEDRYKRMEKLRQRKSTEYDIYVFIDEFADLMLTNRKTTEKQICRIAQLGRAANIHLILATQRPTRDIITGTIKCNLDTRIALHVSSAQDSRNILGVNGAETLPKYGQAYISESGNIELYNIPMIADEELNRLIKHCGG